MPEMPPNQSGATPTAAGAAPAGAGAPPQMGSSPATGPTQNAGHAAKGRNFIAVALKVLEGAVAMVGSNTEEGKDVLKAITLLGKHTTGQVTPQAEKNSLEGLMMKRQQQAPQMAAMQQQSAPPPPPQAAAA